MKFKTSLTSDKVNVCFQISSAQMATSNQGLEIFSESETAFDIEKIVVISRCPEKLR